MEKTSNTGKTDSQSQTRSKRETNKGNEGKLVKTILKDQNVKKEGLGKTVVLFIVSNIVFAMGREENSISKGMPCFQISGSC